MSSGEEHHRTIRSFVRRAGRMTASQERALETLWPEFGIEYSPKKIDFEEIFYVDNTGAAALADYFNYAQRFGVDLKLARVHSGAHKLLKMAGVVDEISEKRFYDTVRNAVDSATSSSTFQNDQESTG